MLQKLSEVIERKYNNVFAKNEALGDEDRRIARMMYELLVASVGSFEHVQDESTLWIDSESESEVEDSNYDEYSDVFGDISDRESLSSSDTSRSSSSLSSETESLG